MKKSSKTNKKIILEKVKDLGLEVGCWDNDMEKLPKEELKIVLDKIGFGSSDIQIVINGVDYLVEYNEVDNECDFCLKTRVEYESMFGEIYEEDWER